ncbi:NAD(P)H-binding protein [Nonomuraea sp. NPDC049419]|uniref:NAD(P)H-binding protein n=1 Tax=Nonomuraea sp. NPDC049419 TaxID=3155772 RepID=UPI00344126C7
MQQRVRGDVHDLAVAGETFTEKPLALTGDAGADDALHLRAPGDELHPRRVGTAGQRGGDAVTGTLEDLPGALSGALSGPLSGPLSGIDTVFLIWPFLTTEGAPAVVETIARHTRRLVYLSSIGVDGDEERDDPIFSMHAGMERLIEQSGLPSTIVRVDTIASNTLGWAGQIRTTGVVRGPLTAATAVIDPRDVAAVAARALTDDAHTGRTYRLTGPRPISRPEQVRAIGAAIARDLRFEEVPVERARARMLADGRPPALVNALLAAAEVRSPSTLVTSTVEDLTGRPPRTFRQWAHDHRDLFR